MKVFSKIDSFVRLFRQAVKGDHQEYTSGSIDRAIFMLSIPMILEMVMESLFAVVDIYFVSRLHDNDAVASVGLTESVLTLVYSIAIGLSMGGTAMVARRIGEKDVRSANEAAIQVIYIGIGVSALISLVGIFFAADILRVMGGSEALIQKGTGYTRWMFAGNITITLLFLINAVFRGAGDASLAMRSLWLANILNMLLGPLFIFGWGPIPGFGVEGAAIATNLGRGAGVVFQFYYLLKGRGVLKLQWRYMQVNWEVIGRLLKVSLISVLQFLIASASWIFLMRIVSNFGSATTAGYIIAVRIIMFALLPAWGMANASATLVGQNLGANQPDRAEKSVWRAAFFNVVFLGTVTVIFLILAEPLLGFFTGDTSVIKSGVQCLQIVCLGYVFYAYGMVVSQSFNGAGDTRTPTLINLVGFWMFQIPLAYTLSTVMDMGSPGVYAAISIAESAIAVAGILLFRRGRWKTVKI